MPVRLVKQAVNLRHLLRWLFSKKKQQRRLKGTLEKAPLGDELYTAQEIPVTETGYRFLPRGYVKARRGKENLFRQLLRWTQERKRGRNAR